MLVVLVIARNRLRKRPDSAFFRFRRAARVHAGTALLQLLATLGSIVRGPFHDAESRAFARYGASGALLS